MNSRVRSLVLAGGALWVLFAGLALRGTEALFSMPIAEDGWYALAVARNVARGLGITIDGATWTNGFQPLFTFMEAGAFRLGGPSDEAGLRFVFLLAALTHLAGALLVASLARDAFDGDRPTRDAAGALAFLGYLGAAKAFNDFYNGLETVLQFALYAAVWRLYAGDWRATMRGRLAMGALLGALVLARIDGAVFVAAFCAAELWRGRARLSQAIGLCVAVGSTSVLVSSPWWLYNAFVFGHPMPISGFAQQAVEVSAERGAYALWALRAVAVPWIFAGAFEDVWTDALRVAALVAFGALVFAARRAALFAHMRREVAAFVAILATTYAALCVYYGVTFFAYWFYIRYFAPLALIAFVYVPAMAARSALRAATVAAFAAAAATAALLVLAWQGQGIFGHSSNDIQVALVAKYVPTDAVVAAGQSGTLGFRRANVVNVDGKVNAEALKWRGHMWDYLDSRGIEWFVDSTWYVELYLGLDPEARGWRKIAQDDDWVVYRRVR